MDLDADRHRRRGSSPATRSSGCPRRGCTPTATRSRARRSRRSRSTTSGSGARSATCCSSRPRSTSAPCSTCCAPTPTSAGSPTSPRAASSNLLRLEADVGYEIDDPLAGARGLRADRRAGTVSDEEMHEVFNMGCGFCCVVAAADEDAAHRGPARALPRRAAHRPRDRGRRRHAHVALTPKGPLKRRTAPKGRTTEVSFLGERRSRGSGSYGRKVSSARPSMRSGRGGLGGELEAPRLRARRARRLARQHRARVEAAGVAAVRAAQVVRQVRELPLSSVGECPQARRAWHRPRSHPWRGARAATLRAPPQLHGKHTPLRRSRVKTKSVIPRTPGPSWEA